MVRMRLGLIEKRPSGELDHQLCDRRVGDYHQPERGALVLNVLKL